ncbi:hypothetical protein BFJ68_g1522 [Fusarium oxysporum]|uniref:Peptidase S53 activation domain-containing protein n=1 Tax=Fusarium oxysporum TaxID=5507 RepID=A0A420RZ36_FUSOX|nr:hypothetical protein BFJ66_g558 [Fusarium oxysporum f. sp. cepae]RKK64796.1 hypothetical protein BFJ67_g230 [Fusarium oxysporum f. sp. cepae]RKL06286.1 hypothetical protein BFJ71_g2845 [Fusarium oxysporum]RKL22271.1 hypothetical protein BFJ68_g1522 [Fusarium oxysporum]
MKKGNLLLSATAVLTSPIVFESLDETPADWQESDSPDPDQIIEFSIGLQPEDGQSLDTALYGAPDPDHPNYSKYLSGESAKALLNPSNEATESAKRWLTDAGIPEHHVRDEDLRIRDSRRSRVSFSKTWLVYPLE